ncbi:MAG: prepilin-type N-terminal cleavage/methylation domain-containing protein [Ramlibacter sp.]
MIRLHLRARRGGGMSGFTLVEILVVMTLMSMVMLALGAAMRTIAQTEERVDQRLLRADEMRVASAFLGSALGRISVRKTALSADINMSPFQFAGAPSALVWVGVMPARYGAGGRYFFRLAAESPAGRPALVIRFAPWSSEAGFPDWNSAQSRILVPDAIGVGLEYADEAAPNLAWLPQWPYPQRLPGRVRVSLRTPSGDWPFLVIPLRQLPGGDNGRGGFSLGPE